MPSFGLACSSPVRNTPRYSRMSSTKYTVRYRKGCTGGDDDATVFQSPRVSLVFSGRKQQNALSVLGDPARLFCRIRVGELGRRFLFLSVVFCGLVGLGLDPVTDRELHPCRHHARRDFQVYRVVGDAGDRCFEAGGGVYAVADAQRLMQVEGGLDSTLLTPRPEENERAQPGEQQQQQDELRIHGGTNLSFGTRRQGPRVQPMEPRN